MTPCSVVEIYRRSSVNYHTTRCHIPEDSILMFTIYLVKYSANSFDTHIDCTLHSSLKLYLGLCSLPPLKPLSQLDRYSITNSDASEKPAASLDSLHRAPPNSILRNQRREPIRKVPTPQARASEAGCRQLEFVAAQRGTYVACERC
jgi:hypothetical protein